MRDLFYAANTFHALMTEMSETEPRESLSIEEEQVRAVVFCLFRVRACA